jgi:putative transposase
MGKTGKTLLAVQLGVSRSSLYYIPKRPAKDWALKVAMEEVLREHPGYGYRRLALALHVNEKRTRRVMRLFGIRPYRRRCKRWRKLVEKPDHIVPNLLLTTVPSHPHHIWATDFTHVDWKGKRLFIATMMDLFTRTITGFSVLTNHSVHLVIGSLFSGIHKHPAPEILHSDRGSEYTGRDMRIILELLGTKQSMSRAGCPWENGYQESFYSQFKVDLGDPNRFSSLGELVYEIYRLLFVYNTSRIHTALRMPPETFTLRYETTRFLIPSNVS